MPAPTQHFHLQFFYLFIFRLNEHLKLNKIINPFLADPPFSYSLKHQQILDFLGFNMSILETILIMLISANIEKKREILKLVFKPKNILKLLNKNGVSLKLVSAFFY